MFGKYSSETPAKSFSLSPDPPTFHYYTPAKHDERKRHIRVGLVCEYMTISMHTHTDLCAVKYQCPCQHFSSGHHQGGRTGGLRDIMHPPIFRSMKCVFNKHIHKVLLGKNATGLTLNISGSISDRLDLLSSANRSGIRI